MIYLDNSASTPLDPRVLKAMNLAATVAGNPSSAHSAGGRVRQFIEKARESVAALCGALPEQVVFTSGGTEANNTAVDLAAGRSIVTTTVEHSSILKKIDQLEARRTRVTRIPVRKDGVVDDLQLQAALNERPFLVSVQWVNNETGVAQDIDSIARRCQAIGALVHVDAAQALGKIPLNFKELPIDFMTVTAHKIHGPMGVGALLVKDDVTALLVGGDQEHGRRAGTENVLGIVGFGSACSLRNIEEANAILNGHQRAFELELADIATINGDGAMRIAGCTNLFFDGIDGQGLVARLDGEDILVSQSSACTNHRPEPSYVLRSMGLSEEDAYASVRFSFSVMNSPQDVQVAASRVRFHVEQLRGFKHRIQKMSEEAL